MKLFKILELTIYNLLYDTDYFLQAVRNNSLIIDWIDVSILGTKYDFPIYSDDLDQGRLDTMQKMKILQKTFKDEFDTEIVIV